MAGGVRRLLQGRGEAPGETISVEAPLGDGTRWGHGQPPHPGIAEILQRGRPAYREVLEAVLAQSDRLVRIATDGAEAGAGEPSWRNPYFFGLDGALLYTMLALQRPRRLVEVGSGFSTAFARRAIRDLDLDTRLLSIDPSPRDDIDDLCDELLRVPLQQVPADLFAGLQAGDLLFLDGSHYAFSGTDSTVALLEIVPRLAPGVVVHVHDVFLPHDYPPQWADRHYNEQYVLAAYLLAGGMVETLLPAYFVHLDPALGAVLQPLWERLGLRGYDTAGHSFWMRRR